MFDCAFVQSTALPSTSDQVVSQLATHHPPLVYSTFVPKPTFRPGSVQVRKHTFHHFDAYLPNWMPTFCACV